MSTLLRLLATVALAALSLCSCATTGENTYTGAAGDTEVVRERRNALLARKLSIANPRSRWEGSRLAVQFDLVNNRSETLDVEWTVDWFDRSGFVVAERSGWQPLRLAARSQIPMLITGPSPDAVTWKLHVRPSQPVR